MEFNQEQYQQKLSEKYEVQCLRFFQEILSLQAQIDLKDQKIQELEYSLKKQKISEEVEHEDLNVNSTTNT